jgi:hypothetical protein
MSDFPPNFGSCKRTLQAKIWCPHPTYAEFMLSFLDSWQADQLVFSTKRFWVLLLGNYSRSARA